MVEFSPKKLIRIGKGSYAIVVPKKMALECINAGNEKIWVAILENHEAPTGKEILKWINA